LVVNPSTQPAATGTLQKLGLLISRGHVLEGLNQVTHVIFDKTGTLTKGKLFLRQVILTEDCTMTKEDVIKACPGSIWYQTA
jgi:Cu2+-exporting ATPase